MQSVSEASVGRLVVWATRLVWILLAVVGGSAFGDALADRSRAVQVVGTAGLWVGWAAVALCLAVPAVATLTVARSVTPGAVVVAVLAAPGAAGAVSAAVTVVLAVLATALTLSAEFGQAFVQASAYGDERRFLLRPPAGAILALAIVWIPLAAGAVAAPLLLAAGAWWLGLPVAAATAALAWWAGRRIHRLARRWLVLVPAGLVVHDHVVLAETLMFRAASVAGLHLALADTGAADVTGPAGGHAVEIGLHTFETVVKVPTRAQPDGSAIHASALLVAPSRPGRFLHAAAARQLPVR